MGLYNGFGKAESQSVAVPSGCTGFVGPVKTLADLGQIFRRDADALVPDFNPNCLAILTRNSDRDPPPRSRIFDGVV